MSQLSPEPTSQPSTVIPGAAAAGNRLPNLVVAIVAALLGVVLFLGLRTEPNSNILERLARDSVPLDQAIVNGKPTVLEFYADWCTSCQAMASDLRELKQDYGDRVNFSMLNVDNTKWLPEILSYRVDGIPHFVFLNAQGQELAQAIGEQPKSIMAANLAALADGTAILPYAKVNEGQTSEFDAPLSGDSAQKSAATDPRSHGASVAN
ncbi:thioredoxin family protein [Limnothrix redekei]|uniref:Thioredoxin family protein n=1 Tax=Limnothrix redekei LRLZ20PSL1 TaxID=3112953 RepID=A0ABW7CDD4_9CYAN